MNRLTIIGNLVRDPETKTVSGDITLCEFTVAVNHKNASSSTDKPDADFFRVTAWRKLGEVCQKYLAKGRKVAVVGEITARAYSGKDGTAKCSLELTAQDVEFLSTKSDTAGENSAPASSSGYTTVENEEVPF